MSWRPEHCHHDAGIILGAVVGYRSPCRCKRCYEELGPDSFLDADALRALLPWANRHRRLLVVSVEDGDGAEAAQSQLGDPASAISVGARDLVARINTSRPCWYWVRSSDAPRQPDCPWCGGAVAPDRVGPSEVWRCDACRIVTPSALLAAEHQVDAG